MNKNLKPEDNQTKKQAGNIPDRLIALISPMISPLGYEVVHIEVHTGRQKSLRLFIDFEAGKQPADRTIGIEDCVTVTKALDEPLETNEEVDAIFKGTYELEVSSPGLDRPLRRPGDFERFTGKEVRIHVYRPLSADELGNADFHSKNPKQKNFTGTLRGIRDEKVLIGIPKNAGIAGKHIKKGKAVKTVSAAMPVTNRETEVTVYIPLPLIAKANLESTVEFGEESKS